METKFNVKDNDICSSLVVSLKLSSIKLKTSKPKDDVISTYKELPNTEIVRDNGIIIITVVMQN
uniref:Uncharacterized protein n=1 Tax=Amphimedon queenslandica TaxID=400682 RepID=A0A1X7VUR1_AMPQE